MAATSLKLPDELKKRIDALAVHSGKTAHAFMVEAIAKEAERAELRRRFGEEAAEAEVQAVGSGKAYEAAEAFAYLKARARGEKARRPRPKAWRRSG